MNTIDTGQQILSMQQEQVKTQAATSILSNSLDLVENQAQQLVEMMQIQDPQMGTLVDIKA